MAPTLTGLTGCLKKVVLRNCNMKGKSMTLRNAISALSALALTIVPVAAQAAPVSRAPAVTEESQELVGTTAWILAAIGLGLVIWGIIELTDDDEPESP